jgi:aminoglycoside N3'-acetyltransferase
VSRTIGHAELLDQLRAMGVEPGGVLLVHAAFSKIGPVERGPAGLIDALQAALGPTGTLAMPSMADRDDEPFSVKSTSCLSMGIVAETFRSLPGVVRSDSPHAFAARGPRAAEISAPHPIDVPHGIDSPVGRLHQLDAQVLLLGVGHDANTTVHLAESLAGVRYRRRYSSTVLSGGVPMRVEYAEIDHCCQNFSLVDEWLEARGAQRLGIVGHAAARLARSRDIVEVTRGRLAELETVFLHPPGVCAECDDARDGMKEG